MFRIVVLNPKGGSGKTTVSTNLAGYFSQQGYITTLMDLDPQGSSIFWAHNRPEQLSPVQLVDAHNCSARVTRSWAIQPPRNTEVLIIDTPARPNLNTINPLLSDASAIVIPVQPSEFDLHTAANFITGISHLLPKTKNICIVANRAHKQSCNYKKLLDFFESKQLPVVATLRDSQNYNAAAEQGLGITEAKGGTYTPDKTSFQKLADWCEKRKSHLESTATALPETVPPDHFMALSGIA